MSESKSHVVTFTSATLTLRDPSGREETYPLAGVTQVTMRREDGSTVHAKPQRPLRLVRSQPREEG